MATRNGSANTLSLCPIANVEEIPERKNSDMATRNRSANTFSPYPIVNVEEIPCCICMQYASKKPFRYRYYGLLENCLHPFCLPCIRGFTANRLETCVMERIQDPQWQNILCPICWRESPCIVASRDMTTDPALKCLKFLIFKQSFPDSNKICPFVRSGLGGCFCIAVNHNGMLKSFLEEQDKYQFRKCIAKG